MTGIRTHHASNVCPCKGHPFNCFDHPHHCGCTNRDREVATSAESMDAGEAGTLGPQPCGSTKSQGAFAEPPVEAGSSRAHETVPKGLPASGAVTSHRPSFRLVVYREWIDEHNLLRQDHVGSLRTFFDDVNDWHGKMGLPVTEQGRDPDLIDEKDFRYRINFLFEEIRELIEADAQLDLPGVADALADIVWVACGTACYYGIPLNEVWAEIRRANNEKRPWREGDPVKPRNYTAGEIVKPEGWNPPDIPSVIDKFIEDNGMIGE